MVATLSSLDLNIDAYDPTERGGHPELIPVECTRVHAEHNVRSANGLLSETKEFQQVRASRLFFSLEHKGESRVGEALQLEVLDSKTNGEGSIAIVSSTTAIEEISFTNCFGRA